MKYQLDIEKDAMNFVKSLPPKQFRQIFMAVMELLEVPRPFDTSSLKGYPELRRKDIGEYRIIYEIEEATIHVLLIGKRNDDQIYRQLNRKI